MKNAPTRRGATGEKKQGRETELGDFPLYCMFVARAVVVVVVVIVVVVVVVIACMQQLVFSHRARQPRYVSHTILHRSHRFLPCLQRRVKEVGRLRAAGLSTVPTTMGEEKRTNPFLRVGRQVVGEGGKGAGGGEGGEGGEEGGGVTEVRRTLGFGNNADDVDVFAELRARKDNF